MPNGFDAQHLLLTPREWFSEGIGGRAGKRLVFLGKELPTDLLIVFLCLNHFSTAIKLKGCYHITFHLHYEISFVSGYETNLGSRDLWSVHGSLHIFMNKYSSDTLRDKPWNNCYCTYTIRCLHGQTVEAQQRLKEWLSQSDHSCFVWGSLPHGVT